MSGQDFTDEQKRYLEGFVSGVQASRAAAGLKPLAGVGGGGAAEPAGPDAEHLKAMARFEAEGKKLSPEEKAKRDEHPFDAYARLKTESAKGQYPEGRRQFSLALSRPVLRGAGAELLHVPPAHPERHSHALAAGGRRRHRRALLPRLCACHHARQPAGARDRRRATPSPCWKTWPRSAWWPRARAPTTSATSPARPRPASTRRSCSTPAPMRGRGTITSSTTARCTACRASSTSASTAAALFRCWRTPTTSPSRRCGWATARPSSRACGSGWGWAASPGIRTSRGRPACW